MRILYDHQAFTYQNYGGVSRYYLELINRLGQYGIQFRLPAMYSNNYYLRSIKPKSMAGVYGLSGLSYVNVFARMALKIRYGSITNYNKMGSRKAIVKGDFDVFHPTYYDPYFLEQIGKKPFILTIHDMIHEIFPEYFEPDDMTSEWKKTLAEKATRIIAVSNNTKRDILKFLNVEENKVHVIYHGSSMGLNNHGQMPDDGPASDLYGRYILFVGDRTKYKNFLSFVESLRPIMKKEPDIKVICAGGGAFSEQESSHFKKIGVSGRIRQQGANDDMLAELYRRSVAFVFPSLYEGFGIPVLEAFACGCPAIVSQTSSLPEVGGDAVVYFDPKDISSMGDAIERVISDEGLRKHMTSKGFDRLKLFSWDNTVKETASIYKGIQQTWQSP